MRAAVVLLAALVASCCVAVTLGLVCLPDACSKQICDYSITAETCQGEFDPRGSACSCCPFCTTLLGEGDSCLDSYIVGPTPPKSKCSPGLTCQVDRDVPVCA
uniref:Uncharacterized protein n=1 Tax=Timema poppense TaxID=170557 RepID=A0A7R9HDD7_TIMPO|nr:unnamed protein product [Timema poppensis]